MTVDELIEALKEVSDSGHGWQEILTPDGTMIAGVEHGVGPDNDLACIKEIDDE